MSQKLRQKDYATQLRRTEGTCGREPERNREHSQINGSKTIDSTPEWQQRRLRALQFQIDIEREKAKNLVNTCIKISKMMHDSLSVTKKAEFRVGEIIEFPTAAAE